MGNPPGVYGKAIIAVPRWLLISADSRWTEGVRLRCINFIFGGANEQLVVSAQAQDDYRGSPFLDSPSLVDANHHASPFCARVSPLPF